MSVALFRDLQLALVHLKRERLTGGPLAESESSQTRRRGRPLSWRRRCATATDHAWAERALLNSSKAGDLVADLFGGSGSTLIGCERRRRQARLIEIDPKYAD